MEDVSSSAPPHRFSAGADISFWSSASARTRFLDKVILTTLLAFQHAFDIFLPLAHKFVFLES